MVEDRINSGVLIRHEGQIGDIGWHWTESTMKSSLEDGINSEIYAQMGLVDY
jgi:hypothetical protein